MSRRRGKGKAKVEVHEQQERAAAFAKERRTAGRRCWYVVQTKTGKETTAAVAIAAKGFQVFAPQRSVRIAHARRIDTVSRPLFPRYIFAAFIEKDQTYGVIRYARGVAHLLCDIDGVPQPVPDAVMDAIRERENTLKAKKGEYRTGYQAGDEIKITVGPWADFTGKYVGETKGKVSIIITIFNRPTLIELPINAVPLCENSLDNAVA